MKKKWLKWMGALLLSMTIITGCGTTNNDEDPNNNEAPNNNDAPMNENNQDMPEEDLNKPDNDDMPDEDMNEPDDNQNGNDNKQNDMNE